jgi:hypothetical protein
MEGAGYHEDFCGHKGELHPGDLQVHVCVVRHSFFLESHFSKENCSEAMIHTVDDGRARHSAL